MWGEVTTYYVSTVMETVVIIECYFFEDSTNYFTEGMKREERGGDYSPKSVTHVMDKNHPRAI